MRNVNEAGRHLCPQAVCSGERLLSAWAWGAGDGGGVCVSRARSCMTSPFLQSLP